MNPVTAERSPEGSRPGSARAASFVPVSSARWRRLLALALAPAALSCALVGGSEDEMRLPDEPHPRVTLDAFAERQIRPGTLRRDMDFVRSAQAREGGVATGVERTAAWLVSRFQLAGLVPAGEDGGYVRYGRPEAGDTVGAPAVVALLPGADPELADQYVILLARFGAGPRPDRAPADQAPSAAPATEGRTDPAADAAGGEAEAVAGAAILVALADALAALPARLPRPVLFMAVSGEVEEWEGAAGWVRAPGLDLSSAAAALGAGRGPARSRDHAEPGVLQVAGPGSSSLGAVLESLVVARPALGLRLGPAPAAEPAWRMAMLEPFAELGVPAVLVWTAGPPSSPALGGAAGEGNPRLVAGLARLLFLATHRVASAGRWSEPSPHSSGIPRRSVPTP
jgi:hypothetical protein